MRIGIDLGTTNTLACYVDAAGSVKWIEFEKGRRGSKTLLPSCVAVDGESFTVGQPALDIAQRDPACAVGSTKYFMGDPDKVWVIGRKKLNAKDAAVLMLKEVMSELKRQFPQERSFHALVTVPARFDTQAPRAETKQALAEAGFESDPDNSLMDEPVAAAAAYSKGLDSARNVLVVDIGGGTFDLSLLRSDIVGSASSVNRVQPVAWGGDMHLGGNDADEVITGLILDRVGEERGIVFPAKDRTDPRNLAYDEETAHAVAVIRDECTAIKKQLYDPDTDGADVYICDLFEDYDCDMHISKEEYMNAASAMAEKMRAGLESVYARSTITPEETDCVLAVGGMARELCLQKILAEMFGSAKLLIPDNAMYLVSRGAAIVNSSVELHVISRAYSSIGVMIKGMTDVDVIVHEGEEITQDFRREREYTPELDNALCLNIHIVEFIGDFDPRKCKTVLRRTLTLKKRLLAKHQRVRAVFTLNKDNLMGVELTQTDGSRSALSVKL